MPYYKYIKNRRVCFVGASPILEGMGHGDVIDSFDIVVRTNGSIYLLDNPSFTKDYGKRIDVLYTNNQFYREMSPLPLLSYIEKGVKHLCMKTCKQEDMQDFNKVLHCRKIEEAMREVNIQLHSATMGAYILTDILSCEPKELYVTGIDFFASKKATFENDNYQEYVNGYLPDKIRRQGNIINRGKKEDGHNFKENADYIYNLFCRHDNFYFPDFIYSILESIVKGEVSQK